MDGRNGTQPCLTESQKGLTSLVWSRLVTGLILSRWRGDETVKSMAGHFGLWHVIVPEVGDDGQMSLTRYKNSDTPCWEWDGCGGRAQKVEEERDRVSKVPGPEFSYDFY